MHAESTKARNIPPRFCFVFRLENQLVYQFLIYSYKTLCKQGRISVELKHKKFLRLGKISEENKQTWMG